MSDNFSLEYLDNLLCNLDSITKKIELIEYYYKKEYEEPYNDYLYCYDIEYYKEESDIKKKYKKELSKLDLKSITIDKSLEFEKKFSVKPQSKIYKKYSDIVENIRIELYLRFFGENKPVYRIFPQTIFLKHFPNSSSNIEFCYWLLNEETNNYFLSEKLSFGKFLNTIKSDIYLNTKLQEIIEFENRVDLLIKEKGLNSYSHNKEYIEEIEYLRIIDDFYESNVWEREHDTHKVKVKYILFKEYILSILNQTEFANIKNQLVYKYRLKTAFSNKTLEFLFNNLISGDNPFFASDTDKNSFLYAFGAIDSIEKFIPLVWVKIQEQKKTKEVSIRSFIDLMELLEIDFRNRDNKKIIETLFRKKNKTGAINPMKLQPKHFETAPKTNIRITSEFYETLKNRIVQCKENK